MYWIYRGFLWSCPLYSRSWLRSRNISSHFRRKNVVDSCQISSSSSTFHLSPWKLVSKCEVVAWNARINTVPDSTRGVNAIIESTNSVFFYYVVLFELISYILMPFLCYGSIATPFLAEWLKLLILVKSLIEFCWCSNSICPYHFFLCFFADLAFTNYRTVLNNILFTFFSNRRRFKIYWRHIR